MKKINKRIISLLLLFITVNIIEHKKNILKNLKIIEKWN